jgi:hypothetical protein
VVSSHTTPLFLVDVRCLGERCCTDKTISIQRPAPAICQSIGRPLKTGLK